MCVEGCTTAVTSAPNSVVTVQSSGVITRWRVRAGTEVTPVRLQVVRRTGADGVEVGRTAEVTPPAGAITAYPTRLAIAPGDQIALDVLLGDYGAFFADGTGATRDQWEPPLSTIARPPESSPNVEVLINADIEPDADNDGFGDETQDACPGVPGTTPDGCPASATATARVAGPEAADRALPDTARRYGDRPSQRIELDVADDSGDPLVTVFDDDGTICVLRAAPYACTWTRRAPTSGARRCSRARSTRAASRRSRSSAFA